MNLSRLLALSAIFFALPAAAQTSRDTITISGSDRFDHGSFYRFFWGDHHRDIWRTPIVAKKVNLADLRGGLTPYQTGGSRQTLSLRARDKDGREYVFRSVEKTFTDAIPEILHGTIVEKLANDQASLSHPYGALIVSPLADAAGILHTKPELFYLPAQAGLEQFGDSVANRLYILEERPDEDWSTSKNLGYSKNIVGTEKMLEKVTESNKHRIDQKAFARARLFDMFIGDWGRHEDQWRWATYDKGNYTLYVPVPRDRDNAFSCVDGFLVRPLLNSAGGAHMQSFNQSVKHIPTFNAPARHLDHRFLNELTDQDWVSIANELQAKLTDAEINDAIAKLPPETIQSGVLIAEKLKKRRDALPEWAAEYYNFISKDVEIPASAKSERIEIDRLATGETSVKIYSKPDGAFTEPRELLYARTFLPKKTNEIRIYGIGGNDEYIVSGERKSKIRTRLIGGRDLDLYTDSVASNKKISRVVLYDNPDNAYPAGYRTFHRHTSRDTSINAYNYKWFEYNRQGLKPLLFFNQEDRFYAGLAYVIKRNKWRRPEFANTFYLDGKYSISQKAVSTAFYTNLLEVIGKWNLRIYANYDQIRWTNFYGLGNETPLLTDDRDFYRMRSEEVTGRLSFDRIIRNTQRVSLGTQVRSYHVLRDEDRFLQKTGFANAAPLFGSERFGSVNAEYIYQNINDSVLPTKGFALRVGADYTDNLQTGTNNVFTYGGEANAYLPLSKKFKVMLRAGGASLQGKPQFFQYNAIGGSSTLRGYQRFRFQAHTTFFNQNELQFITGLRTRLLNGKIGAFGLYDIGRVWLRGEKSDKLHSAYGGGIILSPFNKLTFKAAYAVSEEDTNIHITVIRPF